MADQVIDPDETGLDQVSDDGYWRFVDDQWVATEKQIIALGNGSTPHDHGPVLSDDGFWELIDDDWKPSQKQIEALEEGAMPHNANATGHIDSHPTISVDYKTEILNVFTNLEPQQKMYVVVGASLFALLLSIILIVASISPAATLDDAIKDLDSDGIEDSLDDCPNGKSNWESDNVSDFDGDGCQDSSGDLVDDNDGILDLVDLCRIGSKNWIAKNTSDFDRDGCDNEQDPDDDNDGWSDAEENLCGSHPRDANSLATNSDNDAFCDLRDADDDNDGWSDSEEASCNTDPIDSNSVPEDSDQNNICNNNEEPNFVWVYQSVQYSTYLPLDINDYNYYNSKDHTCCYEDEDYLEYSTPDAGYVIEIAQSLEEMAIANGHTSQLEKAEFILAFVGAIPYVLDPDDDYDHPKYPIEILWENEGDCEDSTALYLSLMEALGYQTILVLLEVKADSTDTWGGHAMVGIRIPGHSGDSFSLDGSSVEYFSAETTAWYDDEFDGIGLNIWHDMQLITTYEID